MGSGMPPTFKLCHAKLLRHAVFSTRSGEESSISCIVTSASVEDDELVSLASDPIFGVYRRGHKGTAFTFGTSCQDQAYTVTVVKLPPLVLAC